MRREVLRAKLHRARVTRRDLDYEGSLTLDPLLIEALAAWPHEAIEIYDITNGARFKTYLIPGARGSGEACINGAAARLVKEGDLIIVAAYATREEAEGPPPPPIVVLVDERNRIREIRRGSGSPAP